MIRYSLLFYNQQIRNLRRLAKIKTVSEIIRSLVDDFIEEKKKEELNVSTSKGGDNK